MFLLRKPSICNCILNDAVERYVIADFFSRLLEPMQLIPKLGTGLVGELLQDRRHISRLSLIYKAHHGLVDQATYLKPGESRTGSHT